MKIGDTVVRKSYDKDIAFKVIDIKNTSNGVIYVLNGVNLRIIADANLEDLEKIEGDRLGSAERIFTRKVNDTIKNIIKNRFTTEMKDINRSVRQLKINMFSENESMFFKRPGKVLHIDGDSNYLEVCLKVYKQLEIDAVGEVMKESEQPTKVVDFVKKVKPDIVVITGHDSVIKGAQDYTDLDNYRNSRYFVESVSKLRDYEPDYDTLVIYAGACQSCYEAILDAGANYASSPGRVLIHCLDPVFVCEKVAYTNIKETVDVQEVVDVTITGGKGVGGLETRGKCRSGYPRSSFAK